jgi:hypothetical protein
MASYPQPNAPPSPDRAASMGERPAAHSPAPSIPILNKHFSLDQKNLVSFLSNQMMLA